MSIRLFFLRFVPMALLVLAMSQCMSSVVSFMALKESRFLREKLEACETKPVLDVK